MPFAAIVALAGIVFASGVESTQTQEATIPRPSYLKVEHRAARRGDGTRFFDLPGIVALSTHPFGTV